jgi:hypothetical protein
MGPKSPEFLELLLVPLAACVIPLRKSLERLHQRFGEQQVVKLLKSKARSISGDDAECREAVQLKCPVALLIISDL